MSFDYEHLIVDIPNYPQPGVVFKDITPLMASPEGFQAVVSQLAEHFSAAGATKVMGAEARGFMVAAPVAYALHAGFVPARKPGKLPRKTLTENYALEYGNDALEIHTDALTPDDKVIIVDDLIATGGTALAQLRLIEQAGAQCIGMGFLMELAFLHPRDLLQEHRALDIFSLVQVNAS